MLLKQKFALGLCALYLVSVIGIAISMHFCGGRLASISFSAAKTGCTLCKTQPVNKKDDNCCKNTKVIAKVKDSHKSESSIKLPKLFSLTSILPAKISELFTPHFPQFFSVIKIKPPPKPSGVALHVFNCVFRN